MTHEIWDDLRIRMRNLRGDMIGQWQGDLDNRNLEASVMQMGQVLQMWQQAEPLQIPLSQPLPGETVAK